MPRPKVYEDGAARTAACRRRKLEATGVSQQEVERQRQEQEQQLRRRFREAVDEVVVSAAGRLPSEEAEAFRLAMGQHRVAIYGSFRRRVRAGQGSSVEQGTT